MGRRLTFLLTCVPLGLLTVFLAGIMLIATGVRWMATGNSSDDLLLWNPPSELLDLLWKWANPGFDTGREDG
jgi:hypothetical protein